MMKPMIEWLSYFEQNKDVPRTLSWQGSPADGDDRRRKLSNSLSHFALGESGEGTRIRRLSAEVSVQKNEPAYAIAVTRFVAEENGHARLLGEAVQYLGGSLTTSHWTETVFVFLRRLLSLRTEVHVLAIAEIIGLTFYRLISERTADTNIVAMCAIFLREEEQHLAFDADTIHWLSGGRPGILFSIIMRCVFLAAMCAAWIDHRGTVRAFGANFFTWMHRGSAAYTTFAHRRDQRS